MDAIQLLLLSVSIYAAGALLALLLDGSSRNARYVSGLFGLAGSLVGVASAALALTTAFTGDGLVPHLALLGPAPFGNIPLQMDPLSAFMVGMIALLGIATSVYSISYLESYENRSLGSLGFFNNLFMACMLLVVTVANAMYFLVFWETMTLASYFLVIFETEKKESIKAGYIYMLVAHAGTALIMLAFLILYQRSGSFDFIAFSQSPLSPILKNLVFLLAFIGFGAKAGMVPLHFWTPDAYSAAPSHASALMSGVMKKTAIYGILRVCVDFLGAPVWWWGFTILAFGALSTVLGVFYALVERDLKRLLAFSSVENVGIILMGIGTGMVGMAAEQPILVVLGFLAALYHLLNHAFFKGLLFLGAGSVIRQAGTQDLNKLGGLARRMPWTTVAFFAGTMAVSAIPPLNGFVSEWFTYQSLLTASSVPLFAMRVFSPLFAILLALAGALALMVFVKAYGGAFTGPAHSSGAEKASEAPISMILSMVYLALGTLVLGIGAPLIAPLVGRVAAAFAGVPPLAVASGLQVFPAQATQAVLSPPIVAILLIALLVVPLLVIALYGGFRAGKRSGVDPWTCGYGYAAHMSISASSFDQPVKVSFHPLYWLRTLVDRPFKVLAAFSRAAIGFIMRAEPVVENVVTRPVMRLVEKTGQSIQALQMGDIRVYCLYIIVTLAILLIFVF
ncbi:MAG: hydrogenase 4 subunit B [Chloroflexota bacterium]